MAAPVSTLVNYSNGTERDRADISKLWVVLVSEGETKSSQLVDLLDGRAEFSFAQVPEGSYRLCVSTDIDQNNKVCEQGEIFARYPGGVDFSNEFLLGEDVQSLEVTVEGKSFNFGVSGFSIEQQVFKRPPSSR